jgi:hypothetical protein
MPFGDIVQELARIYGVDIVFENEELKQQRITATLDERDSIDVLLNFLCASQRSSYVVEGNTYVIRR